MWNCIKLAALIALTGASSTFAQPPSAGSGQAYPNKPIRWVIPFAPGGGTDMVARPVAAKLTERLGQQILYDNRGGGGGVIAGEIVANANPDGYTLLVAAVAVMTVTGSLQKLPFDPIKDFTPITKFANVPNMLAARTALPVNKIQEVAPYAKANPGKLRWALSGTGSAGTLSMELFRLVTSIDIIPIPYKGAGPAMIAVVGNEADLMFANPAVFMPHIKGGRLRALGAASLQRIAALPDMPTFHESGFPGFESLSWYGLAAPARTPAPIIALWHKETIAVLAQPDIIARITADGGIPVGNTPQKFAQEIRDETAKWAKVIKDANIKM
ncbi:MAG TPA: tripartite tricarboxylate transporter substrate binding protein [Burkholderiales bacterium]|nr:tripartite tricarboxylate transporter substrate binding protein [Burkholderiales bacterium]